MCKELHPVTTSLDEHLSHQLMAVLVSLLVWRDSNKIVSVWLCCKSSICRVAKLSLQESTY